METPLKIPVNKFNKSARYILETDFDDSSYTYHLYKRMGCVFVEVDSFNCFAEANEEAKEIIRRSKYSRLFSTKTPIFKGVDHE
jgi:hypothetical protein